MAGKTTMTLIEAAEAGDLPEVEKLLAKSVNINETDAVVSEEVFVCVCSELAKQTREKTKKYNF